MIKVLGIDPGKTNGLIKGWYDTTTPFTVYDAEELIGSAIEMGDYVDQWCRELLVPGRIIAEAFVSHGHHQFHVDANFAIKPLGAVEYVAYMHGVPITYRNPGPPEKSINDELLKSSGYWITGGKGHMRAILRHVLQQLVDEYHGPTLQKLYSREV
jgi:hypothetical protein